jgi:hypothetical protein
MVVAQITKANRPLHLTAPGPARARPPHAVLLLTRVPQVSGHVRRT